jgi:thimet oligopeptidase
MLNISKVLSFLLILTSFLIAEPAANPLFISFNTPVEFASITPLHLTEATETAISNAKESLKEIYSVNKTERNFNNTLLSLDDIYNELIIVYGSVYLMGSVHPDEDTRNSANESISVFGKFFNELGLDEELYRSVKEYSESEEAKSLEGPKKKFLNETLLGFERNGFALSKEKRDQLNIYQDKLSDLSIAFSKNIAEYDDFLILSESEMKGLPEDYISARKTDDGNYKVDLSYPSYQPFMKFAISEDARKQLYIKYNNRASDKNLDVLKEILIERQEMSSLLGYKTFADYQIEDRMAKTPKNVWDFENNLIDRVKEKARMDYNELLEVKRSFTGDESVTVIQPWEASFYNNILLKEKYNLDQNLVKEYFELNNVLDGLFKISQHLFDVQFEEVEEASVWHKDVRMFNVIKDGKIISRFYLDLHPRPNKYSHAACFPMVKGKATSNGYQMPTATLVCNFPEATSDKPALMSHSDVETFFHEFGHVLHNVLSTSAFSSFSGTSVKRDFVEAPSQIFENWAWDYEALSLFAKHYKTGELLPQALHEKMVAAKNVGSGLAALQQVYYGILDMTLHDKYDPNGPESTTDVLKKLQNSITLYPYLEGTNFQAAFGHLVGYAAGYYGYLWSKVYADDMFSIFEKNGIMDKETGIRLRDIVLARGADKEEIELVKEFLQREPNQEAFFRSLGL